MNLGTVDPRVKSDPAVVTFTTNRPVDDNYEASKTLLIDIFRSLREQNSSLNIREQLMGVDLTPSSNAKESLKLSVEKVKTLLQTPELAQKLLVNLEKLSPDDAVGLKTLFLEEVQKPEGFDVQIDNGTIYIKGFSTRITFSEIWEKGVLRALESENIKKVNEFKKSIDQHKSIEDKIKVLEEHIRTSKGFKNISYSFELAQLKLTDSMLESSIPRLVDSLISNYDLHIFVPGTLVIDQFPDRHLQSRNIVLAAEIIDMRGQTKQLKVNGKDGLHAPAEAAPQGSPGTPGGPATPGGDIVLICDRVVNGTLQLVSIGGKGGNGQKGGKGAEQTSLREEKQKDAQKDADYKTVFWFDDVFSRSLAVAHGKQGEDGLPGNDGLPGGNCGKSGSGGVITLITASTANISKQALAGAPGTPGAGGAGGDGGKPRQGGRHAVRDQSSISTKYYLQGDQDFEWYFQRTSVKKEMGYSPRARSGNLGNPGEAGPTPTPPAELIQANSHLHGGEILGEYLLFILYHEGMSLDEKKQLIAKIFRADIPSAFIFKVLALCEKDQIFKKTLPQDQVLVWLSFYKILENYVLEKLPLGSSVSVKANREWLTIGLYLSEKIHFLENYATGSSQGTGQIVDLFEFSSYISQLISDLKNREVNQIKKQYADVYAKRIDRKTDSANEQIRILQDMIDKLMDQTLVDVRAMLDEIVVLEGETKRDIEMINKKKEELASKMKVSMALSVLTLGLGMLGAVSGTGAVFAQISSATLGAQQANREASEVLKQAGIQKQLNRELWRLESMQYISKQPFSSNVVSYRGFDQMRNRDYDSFLSVPYKDDFEIYRKRLMYTEGQVSNTAKLAEYRAEFAKAQQKTLDEQRIRQAIAVNANMAPMLISGVASIIAEKKEYESQIAGLNAALARSQDNLKGLTDSYAAMEKFNDETLQKGFKYQLTQMQNNFAIGDEFYNQVQGLAIRQTIRNLKAAIDQGVSFLKSRLNLEKTLEQIQDVIEVEIEIFDRIERQKDFAALGAMIVGVTLDSDNISEEEKEFKTLTETAYLRNLYLTELQVYNAWMFPFGLSRLNTSLTEELSVMVSSDVSSLRDKIAAAHETLKRELDKDKFSDTELNKNFQVGNFCEGKAGPYARLTYKEYQAKINRLQLGEEVEFNLIDMSKHEAVKFISLYLHIPVPELDQIPPSQRDAKFKDWRSQVSVTLNLKGVAVYKINNNSYWDFVQEPIRLTHRLDVQLPKDATLEEKGFSAEDETESQKNYKRKYEQNGVNVGRSPYTTLSIKLSRKDDIFVGRSEFPAEFSQEKSAWLECVGNLVKAGWVKEVSDDVNKLQVIKKPLEILESEVLFSIYGDSQDKLKELFVEKLKVFPIVNPDQFALELVGYGHHLWIENWKQNEENLNNLRKQYLLTSS